MTLQYNVKMHKGDYKDQHKETISGRYKGVQTNYKVAKNDTGSNTKRLDTWKLRCGRHLGSNPISRL